MNDISLFTSDAGINLIIKTAGNECNIDCRYCFEKNKDVSSCKVDVFLLEQTIQKIDGVCTVVFHGGEPLIVGLKHFEALLKVVEKYYPFKVTAIRVQTNGTLLDDEWINLLFVKYKHLKIEISISLDGTYKMNELRVGYDGVNTFQKVIDSFNLLNRYGISAGMLSVISKSALPYAKEYIELIASIPNIKFVKVNALFNVENNFLTEESITPTEYVKFIIQVSEIYINTRLYKKLPIEPFLSIIQRINGKPSRYCNYSSRKCFNYISLYPDGTIGPCDCLSINQFHIDNAFETINKCITQYLTTESAEQLKRLILECSECDIKDFCMGGCLSQRYYFDGNKQLKREFCSSKHMLYDTFKNIKLK